MIATPIAHGMDGRLVDADWPPLTLAEVRALLEGFPDCGGAMHVLTVSPRPFSAASVVATGAGRVFIKRHHRNVRDREGLLEEHRFLKHLHAQGASVPGILHSAAGETAIEIGEWSYEVHEVPTGVDLYEEALSWTPFRSTFHAHSAGQALARMHLAAESYTAAPRRPRPLVASFTIFASEDSGAGLARYLTARPALEEYLVQSSACDQALEVLAPFHEQLLPLLPKLAPLWTHNDLHASNLLWSNAGAEAQVTAIIDFGLSERTNAVHDLAQAIERNLVEWIALMQNPESPENVTIHFDHLQALLNGYESVRPLSEEEANALAPMTALCHAEFALSEADYFFSVLHSRQKARVACEDYLLAHALWFRLANGQKLLNALQRWAEGRRGRMRQAASLRVGGQ